MKCPFKITRSIKTHTRKHLGEMMTDEWFMLEVLISNIRIQYVDWSLRGGCSLLHVQIRCKSSYIPLIWLCQNNLHKTNIWIYYLNVNINTYIKNIQELNALPLVETQQFVRCGVCTTHGPMRCYSLLQFFCLSPFFLSLLFQRDRSVSIIFPTAARAAVSIHCVAF